MGCSNSKSGNQEKAFTKMSSDEPPSPSSPPAPVEPPKAEPAPVAPPASRSSREEDVNPEQLARDTSRLSTGSKGLLMNKSFPLLVQDTTDADNQMALAGYAVHAFSHLDEVFKPKGIWGMCPRHADLSFPLAFNKSIVKNRPDFRAFEPTKNAHEGTGLVPLGDSLQGLRDPAEVSLDTDLVARNEIRRTYASILQTIGMDPRKRESWDFIQRAMPCVTLPVTKEHLLSHHYFAREFLFDRGDLEGHSFLDPLSPKGYGKAISDIDGDVAANDQNAYDRVSDVKEGLAAARRKRARTIIYGALEQWDKVLGVSHETWIEDSRVIARNFMPLVTDCIIMAPVTLTMNDWTILKRCKRVWGMFFALDNAAEYGHWVMEAKAKNIFRNNFNTALDEEGTMRLLKIITTKEMNAYFHPTELFKGEIGQRSWEVAKAAVAPVKKAIDKGMVDVPPLLALYNCYNAAKSPTCEPQQISDTMIIFEYINFATNMETHSTTLDEDEGDNPEPKMPVASYSPALVSVDRDVTALNSDLAVKAALAKGITESDIPLLVRREQVFIVTPSYEPLNNGMYVGMNLVNRMVPQYSQWLKDVLTTKPPLRTPREINQVLPIMDASLESVKRSAYCDPRGCGCD